MRFKALTKGNVLAGAISIAVGLLVTLEGYSDRPYKDSAGVLTDCYGNTKQVSTQRIRSLEECKDMLDSEVARISGMVIKDVPEEGIPAGALGSVVSWVYNVGDGAYKGSTLRVYLKLGEYKSMCKEMYRWKYITDPVTKKKVPLKGLENRRDQEVQVCLDSLKAE